MFGKEVWKYFFYFLFFAAIAFFVYILYKLSYDPVKEGFQVTTPYYSLDFMITPLSTWNLSLPPEFETKKITWTSIRPHYYIGNITTAQRAAIDAAETVLRDWALALTANYTTRLSYDANYQTVVTVDRDYTVNASRIVLSGDSSFWSLVRTSGGSTVITASMLRRLNSYAADKLVQHMYEGQFEAIRGRELLTFKDKANDTTYGAFNQRSVAGRNDIIRDKVGATIRSGIFAQRLRDNKTKNLSLLHYQALLLQNPDAAKEYLAQNLETQSYLDQVGAYVEQTAIGELIGPTMSATVKVLNGLKGQTIRTVNATRYLGNAMIRMQGSLIKNYIARSGRLALQNGLKAIRYIGRIRNVVQNGKLAAKLGASLGKALRAAGNAIKLTNPVGILITLLDVILSLIPQSEWVRMGESKAAEIIANQLVKCPVGYLEADKLDLDTFNTILDVLPIPAGFAMYKKAIMRKLSCVTFDTDGSPIPADKVQCPLGDRSVNGSDFVPIFAPSIKLEDTCFADPDPPVQLYPIEATPPVLETAEQAFTKLITGPGNLDLIKDMFDTIQFFPDNWALWNSTTWSTVPTTQPNLTTYNTAITTATTEIMKAIREVMYLTPIKNYNTESTTNQLNSTNVPLNAEANFDFYFGDLIGQEAIVKFVQSSATDRLNNAFFIPKTAYADKFISEIKDIFKNDVYLMKIALPDIFSPDDKTTYEIKTDENITHTLFLDKFRKDLAIYVTAKGAEVMKYPVLVEEYNTELTNIMKELTDLQFTPELLDSLAQYIYEQTYAISAGNTVTFIDKILSASIVCDNYITLVCNISCINKGKGAAPYRDVPVKQSRVVQMQGWQRSEQYQPTGRDDSVAIDFYLEKVGSTWRPTAWGRPESATPNQSFCYSYLPRIVKLDYVPLIIYKYTTYFNTKCNDPATLRTQLNYYKELNPNKNIKAIVGQKTKDPLNCVMQWTESTYNPEENTETATSNVTAIFTYQNPNTPYPYKDGKPIVDEYQGFTLTTTETVSQIAPALTQPARGLPPEVTLLGNCNKRCFDPEIMKGIMDKFNQAKDPEGGTSKIINIKKIFTSKSNRCDFVANVNTGKGLVEEQRRRAFITLLSTPACTYRIDSIGAKDTGTFVSLTEGFTSIPAVEHFQDLNITPYPGYFFQSTTTNSPTVPRYNFGTTVLGSIISPIQNTLNRLTNTASNVRLKTYATLGAEMTLDGCPTTKCSSDDVMKAIALKYNIDNWGIVRMNRILKITTASPLECDVQFEDVNVSGSNRAVQTTEQRLINNAWTNVAIEPVNKFAPAGQGYVNVSNYTWNMRFTMRKVPNTCKFEAASYKVMNSVPTLADIENPSQPLFTANSQTRAISFPTNLSSVVGCGQVDVCRDPNTMVQMTRLYQLQNPNNLVSRISRSHQADRETCKVEFMLSNKITGGTATLRDTYNFKFAANSNTCEWKLQTGISDSTDGLAATQRLAFGARGANYVPGRAISLDNLKISDTLNFTNFNYVTPQCATSLGNVSWASLAIQNEAKYHYTLFTGKQITNFVSGYNINSTTCEFNVSTTAGTAFEETHLRFTFVPNSKCSGYFATGFTRLNKNDSFTEGWLRPDNTACYPIKCETDTIKAMTCNYYKGVPGSWQTGEDALTITRTARVNNTTCEYQIKTNRILQTQSGPFIPAAHKRVTFRSVGASCETRVVSASNIPTQADSLTFKQVLTCPNFNPMTVFPSGSVGTINSRIIQGALRQLYLNKSIFTMSTPSPTTFDTVNGPSIRSDGVIVTRGTLLPTNTGTSNMKAEFEIKLRVYLSRPNSDTYPYSLAIAKLGTLISQAANQVDWNDYGNQTLVDPNNRWGPRRPPAEFKSEGIYELSQANFSTWQPIFHPVIDIRFPTLDCRNPAIQDFQTNAMYGLSLVQTRAQTILP